MGIFSRRRKIQIIHKIPKNAQMNEAWIPLPVRGRYQTILKQKINMPAKIVKNANGEQYAYIRNPRQNVVIDLEMKQREVRPYRQKNIDVQKYTKSERYLEANDPAIINIANNVTKNAKTDTQKARQIFEWVKTNIQYPKNWEQYAPNRSEADFGAKGTLQKRVGDCGSESALFVSMCRSLGIPAREQAGIWGIADKNSFHDWAEFYDRKAKKWIPVDVAAEQILNMKGFGIAKDLRIPFSMSTNKEVIGEKGKVILPRLQLGLGVKEPHQGPINYTDKSLLGSTGIELVDKTRKK